MALSTKALVKKLGWGGFLRLLTRGLRGRLVHSQLFGKRPQVVHAVVGHDRGNVGEKYGRAFEKPLVLSK